MGVQTQRLDMGSVWGGGGGGLDLEVSIQCVVSLGPAEETSLRIISRCLLASVVRGYVRS